MTWSGGLPSSYTTIMPPTDPVAIVNRVVQGQGQNPATLVIPALATTAPSTGNTSQTTQSDSFDYAALLARISGQSNTSGTQASATSSSTLIAQAYQFIPQGFVAVAQPSQKPQTAAQKALYAYGNAVGSIIQTFETSHPNEAQILKDQVVDRNDPAKAASVVSLGKALAQVGAQMAAMSDVPQSVATMHASLAQSYTDIGTKLQLIPQAQSDNDFIQAIKNYDATADVFVRNYATLAAYFIASGVVFSNEDPGSVFSFSAQ